MTVSDVPRKTAALPADFRGRRLLRLRDADSLPCPEGTLATVLTTARCPTPFPGAEQPEGRLVPSGVSR
ncbi:hypothetical protein [Streptomyces sp. NPDC001502]|uniref:hypothetical protein n=1 Tax=Streptomyces sp. NPDC001502 TaxID=3364578 RepID=UPI0036A07279